MPETLTENRLTRKRNAVNGYFRHVAGVRDPNKPTKKREPRSPLQAVFLKRVKEEMGRQGVNPTQLSKRHGAPSQTTINDVMLGADPRLGTVQAFASALEVAPVSLLTEQKTSVNIHTFPAVPQVLGQSDKTAPRKARDSKKGAA